MSICVLSEETVRLLGSPLAYSTPVAVVKELVDNALDAEATSVEVLVSANTVDSIEVRDNGHGIQPGDFASLGNRGCTSKLRNFEELHTVGGSTLGFRGDALACAANLSTLQIITRTAAEATASKLFFAEKGGVSKIERVSGPVGTAVKVTDLFARIPVRRQVALKEISKTTSKIRDLIHSYAFARPQIKLTLRVINQSKAVLSYSPGNHGNIKQAALQLFGAEFVSQCIEKRFNTAQESTNAPTSGLGGVFKVREKGSYTIEALLPKLGVDPCKISGGAWFSVDSRPLSSSKDTIQALYSAFKARLKRTLHSDGSNTTPKDPFLAVNITCPSKSYDPNVDPSKNEVLFADPHYIIEIFERFLEGVYPIIPLPSSLGGDEGTQLPARVYPQASESVKSQQQEDSHLSPEHTAMNTPPSPPILGTDAPVSSWVQGLGGTSRPEPQQPRRSPRMTVNDIRDLVQGSQAASTYQSPPSWGDAERGRRIELHTAGRTGMEDGRRGRTSKGWKVDMSSQGDYSDNRTVINHLPNRKDQDVWRDSEDSLTQPMQGVNPWVIAKFNATRNRQSDAAPQHVQRTTLAHNDPPPTIVEADSSEGRQALGMRPVVRLDTEAPSGQQVLASIPVARLPARGVAGGACSQPMSRAGVGGSEPAERAQRQGSSRRGLQGSMTAFQHGDGNFRQPGGSNRRQPARDDQENNWFQGSLDLTGRKKKRHQRNRPDASDYSNVDRSGPRTSSQEEPDVSLDLGAIRRRQVLAENRRLRKPLGGWLDTLADPESAEQAVVPCVEAPVQQSHPRPGVLQDEEAVKSGLPTGDPRAYLMPKECSLRSNAPRKLRRVKSSMLPLETTPAGEETHNLMQTAHVGIQELRETFGRYHDQHPANATVDDTLGCRIDQSDLRGIFHRVEELLSNLGLMGPDNECEYEFHVPRAEKAITAEL